MGHPAELTSDAMRIQKLLCFSLYAASRAMTDLYRPLLDEHGLTYPQYLVLVELWEHGPRSVNEIGESLCLDSGTLSPLLKRLEASGRIRRTRRAEDERVVDVDLTEKGRQLKKHGLKVLQAVAGQVGLSKREFDALLASLHDLRETLSRAAATP
jgi:DNA-binding MarR family transcriptional regulator